MKTLKVVPHRTVGVETSVVLVPFLVSASETIPEVAIIIAHTRCSWSTDEVVAVTASKLLDNLAHVINVLMIMVVAEALLADVC